MNKIFIGLVAGVMALALSACDDAAPVDKTKKMDSTSLDITVYSVIKGKAYSKLGVWTDPTTGCQYLTGETYGGIFMSPRIGADRMPMCDKSLSSDYETYYRLKKQFGE